MDVRSLSPSRGPIHVSMVVPIYNERENVAALCEQLLAIAPRLEGECEIILVDDGSTDGSVELLHEFTSRDKRLKVVCFRRNYGQTAAMQAGIQHASGDVIVTLDGDLQNEPADIPRLVEKLHEGYDVVHGWRKHRQDAWLHRKLPSKIANWLISRTTGFPIHDLGCTLKAMRREIAQELELYGEMHRFIPILAHQRGARCVEIETRHHPRRFGQTKYGLSRTLRVVLDLMTVKFLLQYFASPMKLFGVWGLLCGAVGCIAGTATLAMKLFSGVDMTGNPLLLLTILSMMVGVQFFSLGFLGEVNARIYFSSPTRQNYAVRQLINFTTHDDSTSDVRRAA